MRVAVTGASGFIGTHLTNHLKVEGIPHLTLSHSLDLGALIRELSDFQPSVLIHLASVFIADHQPTEIDLLVDSNVGFGVRVFEACRWAKLRNVIVTGSSWQHFGSHADTPTNLYGALKNGLESVARYYADSQDMRVAFLKLYDSFGPGDQRPKLVPHLLKLRNQTLAGVPGVLEMSGGEQIVDFTHVDNSVLALLAAVRVLEVSDLKFQEFRVSGGEPMSLKKFVELFEEIGDIKLNIKWGARPYRSREIMNIWQEAPEIPNFVPALNLRRGLSKLMEAQV